MSVLATAAHSQNRERLQYVIELIEFRSALRQGERDSAWASDPEHPSRRLIYVFDTNLAYLYFQPTAEADTTRALKMIRSPTDKWIAIITSQFLFDGDLPGRGDYPVFLDPLHQSEEFAAKIVEIRDKLLERARTASHQNGTELTDAIHEIQDEIAKKGHDVGALKKLFEGSFRKLFDRFSIGEAAAPWLLRDLLLEKDLLRPLRLGPFLRGCDIEALDKCEVDAWERHLWKLSDEPRKRSENILRDAKCLARLQAINDRLRSMGAQVRYVLVTADRAIIEAARLRRSIIDDSDPGPVVRNVLQYIPLGNIRDLDNSIMTPRGTKAIERAIDVLFAVEGLDPVDRDRRMDQLLSLARVLRDRLDSIEELGDPSAQERERREIQALMNWFIDRHLQSSLSETRKEVENRWKKLLKNSVNLNQRHILHHYSKWLGKLLETLDEVDPATRRKIGNDYEAAHLRLAEELTRAHVYIVLNAALSANLPQALSWSRIGLGVRLDSRKNPSHAGRKAREIVAIVARGQGDQLHDALAEFCHTREPIGQVTLAGAALALQCGFWNVAAELSRQSYAEDRKHDAGRARLRHARASLVGALAFRGKMMSTDEPLTAPRRQLRAIGETLAALETATEAFEAADYLLEAGLARAELAWCGVLQLLADADTAEAAQICEDILLAVGHCMDNVAARSDRDVRDFTGARIGDIAQARGAAALVFSMLHEAKAGRPIPFAGRAMLEHAAESLDRFGTDGLGRLQQEGTWKLLSEIARILGESRPREKVRLPPDIPDKLLALKRSDLPYFPREVAMIEDAAEILAG